MIQFKSLRLSGFKSFPERTELEIAQGLNGIVGPNGCGKSNLVEALRWVMGDNSPKRMRGEGMEDVIFNGTDKRPARNLAEVSLLIDNSTREAPAAYNGSDELEITRRIEKDYGSNYKINGKTVRLRDVQMLLADTVTGANSPALVSQGRITQIITAKPLERRLILEDSAGISGLFARRHEAELRLRAADKNLQRIEDIVGGMEGRLSALKRQARQAAKYRTLNAQIRQLDVLIAYLEWTELNKKSAALEARFGAQDTKAAEKMATVAQLSKTQGTQAEDLPALRRTETEAAAALQRKKLTLEQRQEDLRRRQQALEETQEQLTQTTTDHRHEAQSLEENTALLAKLEEEHKNIASDEASHDKRLEEKRELRDELEGKVAGLEGEYTTLMQDAAAAQAGRQAIIDRIEQNTQRTALLQSRIQGLKNDLDTLGISPDSQAALDDKETALKALQSETETLEISYKKLTGQQESLEADITAARDKSDSAARQKNEFEAELTALQRLCENSGNDGATLLNDVQAESGFELALSRALGDSLLAGLDDAGDNYWVKIRNQHIMPDLPKGAEMLLPKVNAPEELHIALSQIAYVEDRAAGETLQEALSPGQSIVSRGGDYWRWDGYCVKAAAQDRNAIYLEQKNKLKSLGAQKAAIYKAAEAAYGALQDMLARENALRSEIKEISAKREAKRQQLAGMNADIASMRERRAAQESERSALQQNIKTAGDDIAALEEQQKTDEVALESYDAQQTENKQEQTEKLHETLLETRTAYQEALRAFDRFEQEHRTRKARMQAIADERVTAQNRLIRAKERLKTLKVREDDLSQRLRAMKDSFKEDPDQDQGLLDEIAALENTRNKAATKLQEAEDEVMETGRALKSAESDLAEIREERAAIQATLEAIQEQTRAKDTDIQANFEMPPAALKIHLAMAEDDLEAAKLEPSRAQKDKLIRERDIIGAVNLRAEDEATELEKEVGGLLHERNDLSEAIAELRGGIQTINKEARERLLAAFEHVNAHFQELFGRLFEGGKAHLALVDAEDPLESGLEIFAQPPGKTLQSMTLLSGGEQTLAAIALLFAMFLTNPSPICVLDEIDAPLDDANVDRVCDLLEEISERGETRFIVITHHRLTMARMDRLYGVTMGERGVSQLVSVDLQKSFDFIEAA